MTEQTTLVFLRHGETDWNRENRLQGQQDVPLNALGREQARRNGEEVARAFPDIAGFDFVASPLLRCRETMEIAREAMGLPREGYRLDARLKEITFGDWEGTSNDEIRERFPDAFAARDADKWRFTPPGGESYEALAKRVNPVLDEITRPTLMVAHGGVGRVLRIRLLGEEPLVAVNTDIVHDRVFVWRAGTAEHL